MNRSRAHGDDREALPEGFVEWIGQADVIINSRVQSRHHLDAIACAIAARDWITCDFRWCHPADSPVHPYDFAC